jgi:hypothetical protein
MGDDEHDVVGLVGDERREKRAGILGEVMRVADRDDPALAEQRRRREIEEGVSCE